MGEPEFTESRDTVRQEIVRWDVGVQAMADAVTGILLEKTTQDMDDFIYASIIFLQPPRS